MLYILQSCILLIWLIYVIKKERYSLHAVLTTYLFFVMVTDIPEIIFNQIIDYYDFPTHLLSDILKDNQLGIVFSDGIILPMTNMLVCHYAVKTKKPWVVSFIYVATYGVLEWIYLRLGFLIYYKWNIWISIAIYFFVSRLIVTFAHRLMLYNPPIPYFIRIAVSTYSVTAWFGAILGGSLIGLYQWRPHIFEGISADDRFCDLGMSWIFAFLSASIIPKVETKFRALMFISFAVLAIVFCIFANSQGWLIYHKWNNILNALRWTIPFLLLIIIDHWDTSFRQLKG